MRAPEFRLRAPTPGLVGLPWDQPLSEWVVPDVPLRDIAVGMSRHLVKFVDADGQLWAVKDMPPRVAIKEYCGGSRRWGCPRCVRRAWFCNPSSTPRSWSPATSKDPGSTLWELLHAEPAFGFSDRYRVEGTIRRLNELGFAVDELSLQPDSADPSRLKLHVAVGDRRYHAQRLQELTGLDVGEGQARILLGDLRAYQAQLCREVGHDVDERTAARLWVIEVLTPYEQLAHEAVHHTGTPIQAYCDLLEVRWLLSEKDAHDVGTNRALAALARDVIPTDSAAKMAVAEIPTAPFAVLQSDDDS
jgi:Domain of unknown function (DUF4032)